MTTELISRRTALLGSVGTLVAGSVTLAGCGGGGGSGSGTSKLRAINLSGDVASADLYTGDAAQFRALAANALSTYKDIEAKEYTLRVTQAANVTSLFSGSFSLGRDQNFTAVIWGREAALRLQTLPENENNDNITPGANSRVRVFNATTDSGSVDVFFTSETAELAASLPTQGALAAGSLSSFRELQAGTYRLRVTGPGDPNDVRLDVSGVVLATRQHFNLVLTAGAGGVLLNGVLIQQQGAAVQLPNTKARVRLVAGVDTAGVVAVAVAGTTLVGGLRSPSVGPYLLVNAGALAVQVRVNGTVVADESRTFAAGTDYTLMVFGALAAPAIRVISDDNRLPSLNTRAKIRLVHGANGVGAITLSTDFLAVAPDIALGAGSAYATVVSGTSVRLDVTSAASIDPLYVAETANLQGASVYTVFLLGGNALPTGVIRKER